MTAVDFRNVDIIFGKNPEQALSLLDAGKSRDEILAETGNVLGAANASLAIEEGEICVLMGLSGSGKSTLLRAVNGLNKVTRGQVLVADKESGGGSGQVDIASCSPATLRRLRMSRIAMVFQQFALLPWRTVRENVGFGLELRGMNRAERDKVVEDKLKMVGLDRWGEKYAHELSGGMQQRVGLARAFATDADILLMDEPFSALDPLIRDHLQDELLELQRRLKKTILFVSHDLDEALKIGNHIAIMEGGHIVQYGEPEAIVLEPANDYVREFVAHMNPINVLRGRSLMTVTEEIAREDGRLRLDWSGHHMLSLNDQGVPTEVLVQGKAGRLVEFTSTEALKGIGTDVLVLAPPEIRMRQVLEVRHETCSPVALVEEGRLVGVVGDDEIYEGLLRQSSLAD